MGVIPPYKEMHKQSMVWNREFAPVLQGARHPPDIGMKYGQGEGDSSQEKSSPIRYSIIQYDEPASLPKILKQR